MLTLKSKSLISTVTLSYFPFWLKEANQKISQWAKSAQKLPRKQHTKITKKSLTEILKKLCLEREQTMGEENQTFYKGSWGYLTFDNGTFSLEVSPPFYVQRITFSAANHSHAIPNVSC